LGSSNPTTILDRIILIKERLPKKQKQLCDFIVKNYQSIGLMTIAELAKAAGVGTSTVLRVTNELSYDSYNKLRKELYEASLHSYQPTWWHLKNSFEKDENNIDTLPYVWQKAIGLLEQTLTEKLQKDFKKAVQLILNSRVTNIFGLRSSLAAALYFGYLTAEFLPNIKQLSLEGDFIFDRIFQIQKDEVMVIIAISPYTTRAIEAAQYCHEKNIPIILITDQLSCPIAAYATVILKTEASETQYSIVPAIALLEALVIELGRLTSDQSIQQLAELGEMLSQRKITRT
jgi:DNA-binding MurR/RpiR family transcriptional regulator